MVIELTVRREWMLSAERRRLIRSPAENFLKTDNG